MSAAPRSTSSRPGRTCSSPAPSSSRSSRRRSLPLQLWADRLALVYAGFVLVYWVLPQSWLDGAATQRGQLFAARHDLIPVAAYFLGRLLVLTPRCLAPPLARARRRRRGAHRLGPGRRLPRPAAMVARLRRAGVVRGAARARLQRRSLADCRRTGSSTRVTRTIRSDASSRRSSALSRPRTCS